jgi:NAD(P)-dependent dehydrogenase (short-subunit alcohol dehydrogenase family)
MSEFNGKTVLVTGGSRGLGEAVCRRFAAEGCRVIVNYAHGREAAEAVAREIGGEACGCDISDEGAVETMFRAAGPVDILVNNARIDPYQRVPGMSDGAGGTR